MTHGLPYSHKRGPKNRQKIVRDSIVVNHVIDTDGATGVGWGTIQISDFPEGNILLLGAVANLAFAGPTDANLGDTWNGDYGIGSTPADDGTITAGDVDIIASTALGPASAEVVAATRGVTGTMPVMLDNTDGSLEINLNLLVDDADISADNINITATGRVDLSYVVLGDD